MWSWITILLLAMSFALVNATNGSARQSRQSPLTWFIVVELATTGPDPEADLQKTLIQISSRLDAFGIEGFQIDRHGARSAHRLIVKLPTVPDPDRLKELLVSEGKLEMRAVISDSSPKPMTIFSTREEAAVEALRSKGEVFPYELSALEMEFRGKKSANQFIVTEAVPIVTGVHIRDAMAVASQYESDSDTWSISFSLRDAGAVKLEQWTSRNINNYIAVIYNQRVVSAAYIKSMIGKSGQIDGTFTETEAKDLALILSQGQLPVPVRIVETGSYEVRVA